MYCGAVENYFAVVFRVALTILLLSNNANNTSTNMPTKNANRRNHYVRKTLQQPTKTNTKESSISNKDKNKILAPFVDDLVKQKIEKNQRLQTNVYNDTIASLNNMGINWITLDNLKTRVKRAYAKVLNDNRTKSPSTTCPTPSTHPNADPSISVDIPPPPSAIRTGTSYNIETPRQKRGGRPRGSTNEYKSHIDKCCTEAKNEITEVYHLHYMKMKEKETANDRVNIGEMSKRVSRGTFQFIHDQVKEVRKLPESFSFSYNACIKRITKNTLSITTPGKNLPSHH